MCVCRVCFCGRIYERLIDPPQTELTAGSGVWLGQHTHKHGLFKVRPPSPPPTHTQLHAAVSTRPGNRIGQRGVSAGILLKGPGEARGGSDKRTEQRSCLECRGKSSSAQLILPNLLLLTQLISLNLLHTLAAGRKLHGRNLAQRVSHTVLLYCTA